MRPVLRVLALAAWAAAAQRSGPPPSAAGAGPGDHRLIVRFAAGAGDGEAELRERTRELGRRPGVLRAQALAKVGMAMAECASQEAQERLMSELEREAGVELVTPDSWLHLYDDPAARRLEDLRRCSAQSGCAALGLVGLCCPAPDGTDLACCDGTLAHSLVSLKSFHGKYVAAEMDGAVNANRPTAGDWETFQMLSSGNGTVSLRTFFGKYLTADSWGGITARSDRIGEPQRFAITWHSESSVSLKASNERYVNAEADGALNANRATDSDWERFVVTYVSGNGWRHRQPAAVPKTP